MKFTIMAGELAETTAWVAHALPKRALVPVLDGILVDAGDEAVTFSAFDYDISRQAAVELDAPIDPGRILVPGRLLTEVAKALPKGEVVDASADDREIELRCGKAVYGIPLLPVDDFPNIPAAPAAIGMVATKMFAAAVAQAASAAGKNDTLPMLTGLRLEVGDGLIDLAATDRYRMTWRTLSWTAALDAAADMKALIPAKIVADVARGLPADTSVEIGLDAGLAAFSAGGRCTTVRLLDDQFPDFRSHFAKTAKPSTTATVDAAGLAKAVKRVALMAERSAPIRLSFTRDGVLIEAGGSDVGRASEQADAALDGDNIAIAFDPGKLTAALSSFAAGPVELRMTSPVTPCVLGRPGDDSFRHLVMPIRQS